MDISTPFLVLKAYNEPLWDSNVLKSSMLMSGYHGTVMLNMNIRGYMASPPLFRSGFYMHPLNLPLLYEMAMGVN